MSLLREGGNDPIRDDESVDDAGGAAGDREQKRLGQELNDECGLVAPRARPSPIFRACHRGFAGLFGWPNGGRNVLPPSIDPSRRAMLPRYG